MAEALLRFARAQNATQMVLGASRRGRLTTLLAGKSTPTRLARRAEHIDVHLVSRKGLAERRRPLAAFRGRTRARGPPRRRRRSACSPRQRAQRALATRPPCWRRSRKCSAWPGSASLSASAAAPVRAGTSWPARATGHPMTLPPRFRSRSPAPSSWLGGGGPSAGRHPPAVGLRRAHGGRPDFLRRHQDGLDAHAEWQAVDSRSRSALLAASGQQAREQLKEADAALAALADPAAVIPPDQRAARAAEARHAVARLGLLLADLKDMRRLKTGALETYLRPVDLDEVLAAALEDLGPGGPAITLSMPEDLPDVIADAGHLTRILTSLIAEAMYSSPAGHPLALTAASQDGHAEIRITGYGPPQGRDSEPDTLGFRLARDLTEAMGDTLRCSKNPDGGRTVLITLLAAAASGSRPRAAAHH